MHNYSSSILNTFRGTGVALVTPFFEDGTIDFLSLEKLINHLIAGKVDYLVSIGTTGESVTLTESEKFSVIDFTVKIANGRTPVVAGFGGNNTQEIVDSVKRYHFTGVSGILSTSPYYNKPSQEGIFQHYKSIDAVAQLPVIIYNVPGRSASNIEAETTVRIANTTTHVIAIKEASGNFMQCMKILRDKPENFLVISGDDPITLPFISLGMCGVISVVANAFPQKFSDMVRLCLSQDFNHARTPHSELLEFTELIFREGSPSGIKCALKHLNICGDKVRLPLWRVSDVLEEKIKAATSAIQN